MRAIKFRGKRVDNDEWVYGDVLHDFEGELAYGILNWVNELIEPENNYYEPKEVMHQVIPETVGQFTGLLDKNGNEIYEGDLVETLAGQIATVDYSEDHYQGFICNEISTNWFWNLKALRIEVIGNIHDK